jgi:hypothetical protein
MLPSILACFLKVLICTRLLAAVRPGFYLYVLTMRLSCAETLDQKLPSRGFDSCLYDCAIHRKLTDELVR